MGRKKSNRWPAEKIEAMRKELLEEPKTTFQKIGDREGVNRQRIHQLVGNLNRGKSRSEARQKQISDLVRSGKSDQEIANELSLSLGTVINHRLRAGIKRPQPNKKWTRELILQKACEWYERYGYTPAAADWSPSLARKQGQTERVERFYEFDGPYLSTVSYWFGSWSEMIRQSGLPPPQTGGRGHSRYKLPSEKAD